MAPVPGWYHDPRQAGQLRYWDGADWTDHTQPVPEPQPSTQPAPAAPQAQTAAPQPPAQPAAPPTDPSAEFRQSAPARAHMRQAGDPEQILAQQREQERLRLEQQQLERQRLEQQQLEQQQLLEQAAQPRRPWGAAAAPGAVAAQPETETADPLDQPSRWLAGGVVIGIQVGLALVLWLLSKVLVGDGGPSKALSNSSGNGSPLGLLLIVLLLLAVPVIYYAAVAALTGLAFRRLGLAYVSIWNLLTGVLWSNFCVGTAYGAIVILISILKDPPSRTFQLILVLLLLAPAVYLAGWFVNQSNRWSRKAGMWASLTFLISWLSYALALMQIVIVLVAVISNAFSG